MAPVPATPHSLPVLLHTACDADAARGGFGHIRSMPAETQSIHPTIQQAATYVRARPRLMHFLQFWDLMALYAATGMFYVTGMLLFIIGMYVNYSFAQDFVFTLAAYKPHAF